MAHGITRTDMMAYSGSQPWHSLGNKFQKEGRMTVEEAINLANLDWTVSLQKIYTKVFGQEKEVPGYSVMRMDTLEALGVVGEKYTPIQNREIFSFFNYLVEEGTGIIETCGSLWGGKKVWVLAKLEGAIVIDHNGKADPVDKYVLLQSRHDGKQSVQALLTPIRVVCQNTLTYGLSKGSNQVSIRHTASAKSNLERAHQLMKLSTAYYEQFGKLSAFLAGVPIKSAKEVTNYFKEVFPHPSPIVIAGEEREVPSKNTERMRSQALSNFMEEEDRYGSDWLAALNAATGVTNHASRYHNEDSKFDSVFSGKTAKTNDRAFELALVGAGYSEESDVDRVCASLVG